MTRKEKSAFKFDKIKFFFPMLREMQESVKDIVMGIFDVFWAFTSLDQTKKNLDSVMLII